jgi:hypothetical protein
MVSMSSKPGWDVLDTAGVDLLSRPLDHRYRSTDLWGLGALASDIISLHHIKTGSGLHAGDVQDNIFRPISMS